MLDLLNSPSSALMKALSTSLGFYRKRRINQLLTDLKLGNIDIEDPKVLNEEFISAFINTADAIQKASGHSKVQLLTQFFIYGVQHKIIHTQTDQFHEHISTLSGLSEREIITLYTCSELLPHAKYTKTYDDAPTQHNDNLQQDGIENKMASTYRLIQEKLDVTTGEAIALVSGLQRTGFIVYQFKGKQYPCYAQTDKLTDLKKHILHMEGFF